MIFYYTKLLKYNYTLFRFSVMLAVSAEENPPVPVRARSHRG